MARKLSDLCFKQLAFLLVALRILPLIKLDRRIKVQKRLLLASLLFLFEGGRHAFLLEAPPQVSLVSLSISCSNGSRFQKKDFFCFAVLI